MLSTITKGKHIFGLTHVLKDLEGLKNKQLFLRSLKVFSSEFEEGSIIRSNNLCW